MVKTAPLARDDAAPGDAAAADRAGSTPQTGQAEVPETAGHAPDAAPDALPEAAQERALDFLHASALQHVVLADRKAGILFTLLSAALLFLFTRVPQVLWPLGWAAGVWVVTVLLLLAASVLAFLVVLPRGPGQSAADLLFWGSVARYHTPKDYLAAICAAEPARLARDKAVHCHALSRICARKFRLLRWALLLAGPGLVLFLAALALALGLPPGPSVAPA